MKVALITGCSSGIGREAARRFAREGFRVYASMRRPEDGVDLREEATKLGWTLATPVLDVTSDTQVTDAVSGVLAETQGRIDVLVNNAGYYLFGPIEETSPDELRAQIETNVIGVHRVTRAVLPAMRAAGDGVIVNISSVSGRLVLPVAGPYHVSKWALEALTEALRYEMRPFGVRVVAIEPGPYKTDLHAKEKRARESLRPDSPYAPLMGAYLDQAGRLPRAELDGLVDTIYRAAIHPNPRLRWPVGPKSFVGAALRRLIPDAVYEIAIRVAFGLPRRPRAGRGPTPGV